MSFVKEYTHLFPKVIWNCLFPEGPKALKEISCYRSLKEINGIFLIKIHDIRFIINNKINYLLLKSWNIFIFDQNWSLDLVYIRRGFPHKDVILGIPP